MARRVSKIETMRLSTTMDELLQTRKQLEAALKENAELREQLAEKVKTLVESKSANKKASREDGKQAPIGSSGQAPVGDSGVEPNEGEGSTP